MHKGHKQVSQKSQYLHVTNDVDEKNKEVPFFFLPLFFNNWYMIATPGQGILKQALSNITGSRI